MSPSNLPDHETGQRLERFVDKALRDQPLQRAPPDLENRVMAAIAQRAVAPWWRSNFAQWPSAVRVLFVITSVGLVKLALEATTLILKPIGSSARGSELFADLSWIHALFTTLGIAARTVPSGWIYCGVGLIGALYVMLFGVSAAAYRTLYASR